VRRWLPLALAGLALLGAWALIRAGLLGGEVPSDRIDRESRQRLERVLREAERVPLEPGGRP
jgi:hypothetical protein